MSSQYTFNAPVGAVNPESQGTITNNIDQRGAVADELSRLHTALQQKAATPEAQTALSAVKGAEQDARNGDHTGMLAKLKQGGSFLLGVAKDIGVKLITDKLEGN